MFFTFLTTWILTTPGRTVSASSLKFAGTIGLSETADTGVADESCGLIIVDIPYPVPSMDPANSRAIKIALKFLFRSMFGPPFMVIRFRLGPAFRSAFNIKIEPNRKVTRRLQIGNVRGTP
jgi:hypothetical protein